MIALAGVVLLGCTSGSDDDTTEPSAPPSTAVVVQSTEPEGPPTSDDFDRSLPEGDDPEVLGPLGETQIDVETEDGGVQIGSASVPDAVDDAFPLPDDLVVQIASESGAVSGFSGVSQLSFAELVEFYEIALPAAGYESTRSRFVDDVVAVFDFEGPAGDGQVAVSSAPGGGRSVLVTFTAS